MKIGFIGMGNMAQALCAGFTSGPVDKKDVFAYAPNQEKLKKNAEVYGFTPCGSLLELVKASEVVIMACKPYQIEAVLHDIKKEIAGKALVSVAAGWDFEKYSLLLGSDVRIQYVMPNTPAMVGEGVLLFEEKNSLDSEEREEIKKMFAATGVVVELPTKLMKAGMAVTGCGPAFVDLMMEAYGDAAVKYGIPRPLAYQMVSQMILGSAKLQLETGTHPGVLKDNVCSPGGTTIKGVVALEKANFRNACIESIDAIMQ